MKTYKPELLGDCWPWFISPKLNGVYAEIHPDGMILSKTAKYFPAVQKSGLHRALCSPDGIIVGELYRHGWPLQKIISAVSPDEPNELSYQIQFHAHGFKSKDYPDAPNWYGFDMLMEHEFLTAFEKRFDIVRGHKIMSIAEGTRTYKYYLSYGYEGAVYTPYNHGESLKRKPFKDEEYICVGVTEGNGKRKAHVGKFILRTPDGRTFGCGGGRVSYDVLRELFANPPIGKLVTVRYQHTSDDGIPLCPQFISVRNYE